MHISFAFTSALLALAAAQTYPECTMELARTDDCAAVINANACYNKFRWNAQTLTCIDGTDNAAKQKMVRHDYYSTSSPMLTVNIGVQVLQLRCESDVRLGHQVEVLLVAHLQ